MIALLSLIVPLVEFSSVLCGYLYVKLSVFQVVRNWFLNTRYVIL